MSSANDRRQNADRRNAATRRRHADVRSVHVELCRSTLRVAIVVQGHPDDTPKLQTKSVRWRHEAPDLLCEQGELELTAALRQIVVDDRLAGCHVSFAISSTLCVNRATSGALAKVEQDINAFKDRSQLYLALGRGAKMSAVGRKAIDARHEHALVTVANRETIRLLAKAAESAGLEVDVIESSLVALCRLHGELEHSDEPAILAQLDEDRFEIGVGRNGQLLLEYRPPRDATLAGLGAIVEDHHDRLERFCGRRYGLGSVSLEKLWLVGDAFEIAQCDTRTALAVTPAVLPIDGIARLWECGGAPLPTAEMGAVLGLALRGRSDVADVSPNLMDEIHATAKPPLKPLLMRSAAPIAATLLLALGLYVFNVEQRMEIAALRSDVAELRPLRLRGELLGRRLRDATIEIEHLSGMLDRGPNQSIEPLITRIGGCLPDDLWLKKLSTSEGQSATVTGVSYTEPSVYELVEHLRSVPGVDDVALRGTGVDRTPQGPATSFEIRISLAPATPASEEAKP